MNEEMMLRTYKQVEHIRGHLDDVLSLNNSKFGDNVDGIYPFF
jgi:hypothetical protein